ncbi:hypothetical protein ACQEVC_28460 [Plantactinospora sp. CA-294935]|uniref:hypothetical protein n=1 Tax=Plantactinospora sp. CA-294935 TaxID=3240012 RepID=UPI003D8BF9A6
MTSGEWPTTILVTHSWPALQRRWAERFIGPNQLSGGAERVVGAALVFADRRFPGR